MIYTFEFLTEEGEIAILKYDAGEKKLIEALISVQQSLTYEEPAMDQIYFCAQQEEKTTEEGLIGHYFQRLADLIIEPDDTDTLPYAYLAIAEAAQKGKIEEMFEFFIDYYVKQGGMGETLYHDKSVH